MWPQLYFYRTCLTIVNFQKYNNNKSHKTNLSHQRKENRQIKVVNYVKKKLGGGAIVDKSFLIVHLITLNGPPACCLCHKHPIKRGWTEKPMDGEENKRGDGIWTALCSIFVTLTLIRLREGLLHSPRWWALSHMCWPACGGGRQACAGSCDVWVPGFFLPVAAVIEKNWHRKSGNRTVGPVTDWSQR
jgi:hypothetical protein